MRSKRQSVDWPGQANSTLLRQVRLQAGNIVAV